MTTIFLLTDGDYSDYHVVAAFSTLERAEKALALMSGDSARIEEYGLDSLNIPDHPPGHFPWIVSIDPKLYQDAEIRYSFQANPFASFEMGEYFHAAAPPVHNGLYEVKCWARDREHAQKIALDKYYLWLNQRCLMNVDPEEE